MTSGTTACQVKYDQAGNANYNAAPELTESVTAQKASQAIAVTTHAPASAVFNSQFTVAANAPGGAVAYSSGGSCSNSGATFTVTSGTGTCTVKYDQAGSANYNAAAQVTESVTAETASRAWFGQPGGVLEQRRLLELGRDVHDDERHDGLPGQVRPGRQRELQRGARGDRVGDRAEGQPGDHGHDPRAVFGRVRVAVHGCG